MNTTNNLYIGILSGTSMDSIDTALVEVKRNRLKLVETYSHLIEDELRNEIAALCYPGENAIQRMGTLDVKLGRLFSHCVKQLLDKAHVKPKQIAAIGSHGQNIRHMPNEKFPFTIQIGDPNIIAAETGITTIADFRRRDIALGGQGAPLTPAFHNFLFQKFSGTQWVINIGGITNITLLKEDSPIIGFDTGPGNTLMDAWCLQHRGQRYDKSGQFAKSGAVDQKLLQLMLEDPYFSKEPPKSTGLEYFNLKWLTKLLRDTGEHLASNDVQATLVELTAITIANAVNKETSKHIWICGGGAKNTFLMDRLQNHCKARILSTDAMGIPVDWIEACAFAWFAHQTQHRQPCNIPSVTGASSESILGAIFCN